MLSSKTKDDFIKFVNKTVGKSKIKPKSAVLDPNAIKNSIMKTIQTNNLSSVKLGRFLRLLPKKVFVNLPLLIAVFFELEKDGWIEIESTNFLKTITVLRKEWIPLPTKKSSAPFDIDLALIGIYDDQNLKMKTNPLINEKTCLNESKTHKTIKNLNDKQIDAVDHLNVIQNWFLHEFLTIYLAEKSLEIDSQILKKIIDLKEYNEKVWQQKLKQMAKNQKGKTFDLKAMAKVIDDCLNGHKVVCPEFEGINKKTQQKLSAQFQAKIHHDGVKAIMKKMSTQHPDLLVFFN